jgi:uncharacterized membrane protein
MSTNPYAAPKAAVADATVVPESQFVPGGKGVPAGNGWSWIADGWSLFKDAPGTWIGIILVFAVIFAALSLIPFAGSLASMLLGPVFGAGVLLGCRSLDRGAGLEFNHLFAGFKTNVGTLIGVGALYLGAWIVIFIVTMAIVGAGTFALFMGGAGDLGADPAAAGRALMTMALAGLIMLGLSVPVVMAIWFAPALVVFHEIGAVEAMKQSFSGCLRNIVPFLVYGIVGLVLAILATLPLALGWLALGPVIAASIYTAYKDIYLA